MGKRFLERQKDSYQKYFDIGEEIGIQKMSDYIACVLKDPRFMGKDTFGRERINKFFDGMRYYANTYEVCFTDEKESDYMQEQLDIQQRQAFGDDAQPFYERYPYLKQVSYNKPKKGWTDG